MLLIIAAAMVTAGCSDHDTLSNAGDSELTETDIDVMTEDLAVTLADEQEGVLTDYTSLAVTGSSLKTMSSIADTGEQNRGTLTVTRVRVFYDAEENASDSYDPQTSVAMERMLWINGTRTNVRNTRTATIDHFDSVYVSGIAPADTIRVLNGAGHRQVISEFVSIDSSRTHSFEGEYDITVTDLTVEKENPYPLDGEIATDIYRHRMISTDGVEREVTVELSTTVLFDGTNIAVVVLPDGSERYIDLDGGRLYLRRATL
jgi:hypothetical protein